MCLAVPGRVLEVFQEGELRMAKVAFGGVARRVCLEYTPEAVPGDYVLVHVGFALSRIDEAEAERTFALLRELDALELGEPA
jgi:hydrogenase expression/formation protein HypC